MNPSILSEPLRQMTPVQVALNGKRVPYAYRETVQDYLARQLGPHRITWVSALEGDAVLTLDSSPSGPAVASLVRGITSLLACPLGSRN